MKTKAILKKITPPVIIECLQKLRGHQRHYTDNEISISCDSDVYYKLSKTCQIPKLNEIYDMFFGQKNDGVFVEIGAFDGESYSNTSCLADLGWTGHYVEPVKENYDKCVIRHAKNAGITVHNIGIGMLEGEEVEITSLGPLSTIRSDNLDVYKKLGWVKSDDIPPPHAPIQSSINKVKIQLSTLNSFLNSTGINPGFDLLVVDVEGFEAAVLSGFPLDKWKIAMIIVELHDANSSYTFLHDEARILHRKFLSSKYIPIYKDFSNCIYVASEIYG